MQRTLEHRKRQLGRQLLKRPQTLAQLAGRIGGGVHVKELTRPIGELVQDGLAVRHHGRPALYSRV